MDHNSSVNQRIKEKFVGQHVYANVTMMASFILKQSFETSEAPFSEDDIENYFSYPEFHGKQASFDGGSDEDRKQEIQNLQDRLDDLNDEERQDQPDPEIIAELEADIESLEQLDTETAEIFEWWIVSSYLLSRLKDEGECVIDGYPNLWGRCSTGQAILLDGVISRICEGMGILDGQPNSWANSPDIAR